jgi:hypothetical protein
MAQRAGIFADVIALAGRCSWRLNALLAVVSGLAFHLLALSLSPASIDATKGIRGVYLQILFAPMAAVFQWVFPLAFLLGSWISYQERMRPVQPGPHAGIAPR